MQGCARVTDGIRRLLLASVLLAAACTSETGNSRFRIEEVNANWASGRLYVSCRQQLALSAEAREALVHGVTLTLELEFILRDASSQSRVVKYTRDYELSYLPLSEHFQVTDLAARTTRTWPRLRHALAWLSSVQLSFGTGVLPAGEYELLARSRLDTLRMPPPMRLPTLFSAQWTHDSAWTVWPIEIHPGA